jgi:Ca2+-binding RTX toxin-like protein
VQPGDFIDGQGGTDTANYTLSAALLGTTMSVNATAVEVFNLTSIGSNAATFNTTNVTGATNFNSVKSTSNLKVSGLASTAPTFGMTETGSNFTIEFTDAALAGAADKVSMVLNGVTNTSTVTIGSVSTPNAGVESLSVKTEGAGSRILTLNTVDLESLTVTGDKSFRVSNALGSTGLETVDASGNSGGVRLDFTGNTENMTITGGSGNDRFAMGLSLNGNDKINTGGGNDTVTFDTGTNGALMGVDVLPKNLQISNAETIGIDTRATGAVTTGAAEFDLARVPGATGFILEGGNDLSTAGGTFTIKNFKSGGNLILESDVTGAAGIVIDSPESGLAGKNSDSINIALNQATDQTVANLTISNIETANIAMAGAGKDSIAFTDTGLKTVNITGTAADLTLTNTSNSVTTIDGSATDADLLLAGFGVSAAGATITGGSGDDTLVGNSGQDTIVGGSGNDTITGAGGGDTLTGGGGADRFVFAAGDSKVSALDVITDFATGAGNDQIMVGLAFSALNGVEANAVSGKATLLEAAQEAALYSTNEATVFSFGGQTYFLADMDASGTYTEAGDVLVQLTGVTVSNFVAGNVV